MYKKKSIWILLFSLFSFLFVSGENLPTIEHLTSNNGLSHNTVRCMLQDKTGFIWFGTLNGLNRYDGVNIKSFKPEALNLASLSSAKIKELRQDSYGHIWVRTYTDMMHCYDPKIEGFVPIFESKTDQQLKHNFYYEDKQKNIWLGSVSTGCVKISFENDKITSKRFVSSDSPIGLPSNNIHNIFQDSKLNTWILTDKGISLYKNNKISTPDQLRNSLSYIKVFEINNKVFFITSTGKIDIFNLLSSEFEQQQFIREKISVNQTAVFGDDKIYISTYSNSVFIFNTTSKQFSTSEETYGERPGGTTYLESDKNGNLWTYNFSGNVWLLKNGSSKAIKLNLIPPSILQLIDYERYQFLCDKHNNVWITTYGNGLFSYNLTTNELKHYGFKKNTLGLSSNYLLSIVLDKNENIWVGTESMGINKLSFSNRNVQIIYPDEESSDRNVNEVKSFLEDQKGNIWVSTKAGNLYIYDSTLTKKKTVFNNQFNVYDICQDRNNTIWLATKRNGIIELENGDINKRVHYYKSNKPGTLSNNTVFSLTKDNKDRLWAATFGGGICVKTDNNNPNSFQTFFNDDEWIRFTRYIFKDKSGNIWAATSNGVIRFNPDELLSNPKAYKYYTFNVEREKSLSNPEVRYIFQDSKGSIWLATAGGGLNKYLGESPDGNGIFKAYNNQQGTANDNIMAIQEDRDQYIWISSESGIHKLNPNNDLFQYFKFSNDFSSNIFSEASCLTSKSGKMFWGSLNGFYVFNPTNLGLQTNENNNVVLTGFFIYDQKAKIDFKDAPLKQSISFSKNITLQASDKVFHIEFSNLNFRDPKANQFMYMLEDYEKRWNLSGAINVATYRNVPPGNYTFKVKSVNSEGVWDDNVTSLNITIEPPFWQSNIAIILYLIAFVIIFFIAFRLIVKFYKLNNAIKVERQLTDYKLRFFTNISHEFRTPLTLIKGSMETLVELKNKMNEPLQHLIEDLDKNTNHLLRLIDQLMEFRKLQNNKQKLNLQETEVVGFVKEIFTNFSNVATKSNINYQFQPSAPEIRLFIDRNKVDKIVFNLLSNAFKFTPRGGNITVIVSANEKTQLLQIKVKDNGIGIPKEKQNLLFSRFMQINFSAAGTGVGLSLVNEFTNIHKGTVKYEENEGGGSVFTVELALNCDSYSSDDFVKEDITITDELNKEQYKLSEFIEEENETLLNLVPNIPNYDKKYKILVIDDNDDIRDFLSDKLNPYFEIITAEDGEVGIRKSMDEDPDLIICDVMMPGMNGFQLTKRLKDDFATCHIPVVLLTAYISDEHHTEGIQAGADAYISKPFSMKHLLLQINKLLEKREKLNMHYANNEISPKDIDNNDAEQIDDTENTDLDLPDRDQQFLALVEELLENHLTNPDFSVDDFAAMTNTGRTLFFKKIKFLTGYSPNEFIRVRRMKKAAELLKTYKYNVSEVSYMVGINDPFYFSKCFKAQYGCSPSKYLNNK